MGLLLLLLCACEGGDPLDAYRALDYRIDRPRVVGVSVDPPVLAHDVPAQIDALVLSPEPVTEVNAALCGLRDDIPVQISSPECFLEEDLVTELSSEVPFTWDPPDLSHLDCGDLDDIGNLVEEESGLRGVCHSLVPLRITARSGDVEAMGQASVAIRVPPYPTDEPLPPSLQDAPTKLHDEGDVHPGAVVDLRFELGMVMDLEDLPHEELAPEVDFRWYVDGGELLETGRTLTQRWEDDLQITENRLRIPADWEGPLRVAVVAHAPHAVWAADVPEMAWEVHTLEVTK